MNLTEARDRLQLVAESAKGLTSDEDYQALDLVLKALGKCDDDHEFNAGIDKIKGEIDLTMRQEITRLKRELSVEKSAAAMFLELCKTNGISEAERRDLPRLYRWQQESLEAFRGKFGAHSNLEALDRIDTILGKVRELLPDRLNVAIELLQPLFGKNQPLHDDAYGAAKDALDIAIQLSLERIAKMEDSDALTCVFCGHIYRPGTPPSNFKALAEHVLVCKDHPAFALRNQLRESELAYAELSQISAWWIDPGLTQSLVIELEASSAMLEEAKKAYTMPIQRVQIENQIKGNKIAIAAVKPTTSKLVDAIALLDEARSGLRIYALDACASTIAKLDQFLPNTETHESTSRPPS